MEHSAVALPVFHPTIETQSQSLAVVDIIYLSTILNSVANLCRTCLCLYIVIQLVLVYLNRHFISISVSEQTFHLY